MPLRYRIVRWLLRTWFAAVFRKIRLLGAEDEAESGATVLLISHPPRVLEVLLLTASLDRQLHCLIDPQWMSGTARRLLAWSLGMITDTRGAGYHRPGIEACRDLLERGGTVVVFAEPPVQDGDLPEQLVAMAQMTLEMESSPAAGPESAIVPVQMLIPFARFGEALIHFGEPVFPQDLVPVPGSASEQKARELALAASRAGQLNPFALRPDALGRVLADLAEALRSDLAEDWASTPNWKQTVEGFTLSQFIEEWAEQTNRLDPDKLVTLREELDAYREARRRRSLRAIQVANADWARSTLRRTLAWVESLLGLPVACYGFLNHLPAALLLALSGLWRKARKPVRPGEWAAVALIVLACYAGAIALANQWFGRATAGYYAVTLPISGVYLWRYARLWRHTTRLLPQELLAPVDEDRLRRRRKRLIAQLDSARNAFADRLGVAH